LSREHALQAAIARLYGSPDFTPDRLVDAVLVAVPGATSDEVLTALDRFCAVKKADLQEEAADCARRADALAACQALYDGQDGLSLGEACRRKAAQGDPFASQLLAYLDSPAYKVEVALFHAAAEAHPQWEVTPNGGYRPLSPDAPGAGDPHIDPGPALIEWFQMNHPREAKRIEAEALSRFGGRVAS